MMNNSWYRVKLNRTASESTSVVAQHPVAPGAVQGGWMPLPQVENKDGDGTGVRFTLNEVNKHNKETDCWIVLDKKVYVLYSQRRAYGMLTVSWHRYE